MTVCDQALRYADGDLSVFSIRVDGSKAPISSWTTWQERRPTAEEIQQLFRGSCGIAVAGGAVSGNLEILDVDEPELVVPFEAAVRELSPGLLEKLPTVATPRNNHGGRHYFYRLGEPPAGNTKLALSQPRLQWNEDGTPLLDQRTGQQRESPVTMVETRGTGGYVLTVGSPGACHPTGLTYKLLSKSSIEQAPVISAAEHAILWKIARSLNRFLQDEETRPAESAPEGTGQSPGDSFEQTATWDDILLPEGWAKTHSSGEISYWRRPGKSKGWSATTGCKSKSGRDLFCVFTHNAPPFEGAQPPKPCTAYGKFAAYALLNHNGDYSAAARALANKGHGTRHHKLTNGELLAEARQIVDRNKPGPRQQDSSVILPVYQQISLAELDATEYDLEYLIDRTLVAGQPCLMAGGKKTLKTPTLMDLGMSLATGNPFLGKLAVLRSCRVAFMSGESGLATLQETARRVAYAKGFNLADITGMIISPDLPICGHVLHMEALERFLRDNEVEVLILDPAYLCLPTEGNEGSLFAMGALLRSISEVCRQNGATLILAHHTRKNVVDPFAPVELEDIAWAGFPEFARQWLLLSRREKFEPGTGEHHLWMTVGGSAGHSSLWGLDISEGVYDGRTPRYWNVNVVSADDARNIAASRSDRQKQARHDEQLDRDKAAVLSAVLKCPEKRGTKNQIRDLCGRNGQAFNRAFGALIGDRHLVECEIRKANRNTPYLGYTLGSDNDEK
jgi:hypothetical protein